MLIFHKFIGIQFSFYFINPILYRYGVLTQKDL